MNNIVMSDRCRVCGCNDNNPCMLSPEELDPMRQSLLAEPGEKYPCAWFDVNRTLCTNPKCIAKVPLRELVAMEVFV